MNPLDKVSWRQFTFTKWPGVIVAGCPVRNGRVIGKPKNCSPSRRLLPGGVDSPVRAFKSVGATPLFIVRGRGAHIEDADGHTFIDYVMSWGPLIHGHAPKGLLKALAETASRGTSFGAPTELETRLAHRVAMLVPSMERVRFVSSGTEAAMSAIRIARAATTRDKIIKFEGCYHGHADAFLVQAGSGATTLGVPTSPGVPAWRAGRYSVARYNDLESVQRLVDRSWTGRGDLHRADRREPGGGVPREGFLGLASESAIGTGYFSCSRSDLRIPRSHGGSAEDIRRAARFDVPGENHRGWTAGGRVRRTCRPDGARRAGRACVPGRDVIG